MTESTNSKINTLSWLDAESSNGASSSHQSLRNLAWKVAPNLFLSFKYAWQGVRYAFATQRNFRIHTCIATLAISLGLFLHISAVEMAIVSVTCAIVMVLELLNTAIESVVDLTVKQTYHELAKIAKDCAAGAVLISSLAAVLVAAFILLPPLYQLIISL
ncbi:MAG: diacylglycerol kinase family protein [Xenococcus sp. (in: cyanobacteria)]